MNSALNRALSGGGFPSSSEPEEGILNECNQQVVIMVEDIEPSHGGTHTKNKMSFLKEFERFEKQDIIRRYNQPTNEDERLHM